MLIADKRLEYDCPFCGSGGHVFVTQRKADEFVGSVACVNNDCEARGPAVVAATGAACEAAALKAWDDGVPPQRRHVMVS